MKSRTLIFTAVLLACFLSLSAQPAFADNGKVQSVSGTVEAVSSGAARTLAADDDVNPDDLIRTGKDSKVQILFPDQSVLVVGAESELLVRDAVYDDNAQDKAALKLVLNNGIFRFVSGKITANMGEGYQINTAMGYLGIRGTEIGSIIQPDTEKHFLFSGGPLQCVQGVDRDYGEVEATRRQICRKIISTLELYEDSVNKFKKQRDTKGRQRAQREARNVEELLVEYQCAE